MWYASANWRGFGEHCTGIPYDPIFVTMNMNHRILWPRDRPPMTESSATLNTVVCLGERFSTRLAVWAATERLS
jgi:hypothetical protein